MDSTSRHSQSEIIDEVYGYIKIYNDGTVERPPFPGGYLPACSSFVNGIATKDVDIHPQSGFWARLFLPECVASSQRRVPVVLHFHGGGLCAGSPAVASFHKFCSMMAIKSESIWVSVDYRLAPEHRLPAQYDDGFAAFMWLCSQAELQVSKIHEKFTVLNGERPLDTHDEYRKALGSSIEHGTTAHHYDPTFGHDINGHIVAAEQDRNGSMKASCEQWLCSYGDFSKCFLAGESSGGAIVHHVTMRLAQMRYSYSIVQIKGLILIHSAFLVKGLYDESLNPRFERRPDTYRWLVLPIGAPGDHPLVNPLHPDAPSFKGVVFPPTIVAVADGDRFYEPCLRYVQVMMQHGHLAELDITKEEGHCFYLYKPKSRKAELFYEHLVAFMRKRCTVQQSRSFL